MSETRLQWHPAFAAAMEIELEEERDKLQFFREYNLTKMPLQMDVLIIKLAAEQKIKKNIGRMFREHNIIEYKSPDDYISINDFYKVMAYACLYQSDTETVLEIDPAEITITFAESRYPKKLIRHLTERYGVSVENPFSGITYVHGLMFPLQIVVNEKLPKEENIWLSRLGQNLTAREDIEPLARAYKGKENNPLYAAVMDCIIRANEKECEEGAKMCEALRELFAGELEERWQEGLRTGIQASIQMCKKLGGTKEQIVTEVKENFQLSAEKARECVEKYWEA